MKDLKVQMSLMMKMNKKQILFFLIIGSVTTLLQSDQSCISIHYHGKLNSEQGPVGYQNCPCTCQDTRWLIDGSCPICTHKHAYGNTVGNIIAFKEGWLAGLEAYIENKHLNEHVAAVEDTLTHYL